MCLTDELKINISLEIKVSEKIYDAKNEMCRSPRIL